MNNYIEPLKCIVKDEQDEQRGRLIITSDWHGKLSLVENLFNKLNLQSNDTIIYLGDAIDRGEDSKGCIDFILNLKKHYKVVTLLGNHEKFVLEAAQDPNGKMARSWLLNGGMACIDSYDPEFKSNNPIELILDTHGDYFNNLQLTYETENFIFVHGYLSHELDVEDQEEFLCIWGRFKDIWPHKSGKTVVCGHSIQKNGPTNHGFKICIDTGGFLDDGYITAMVVEGAKVNFIHSDYNRN